MNVRLPLLVLPAAALAGVGFLLAPTGRGFNLNGDVLNLPQRDFRVFNNFTDPEANDNTTGHPNFPGYTGAVLAIWKAAVEWGSELHADGAGDPHQGHLLGSGGANFDYSFQGEATGVGGTNDNILSELSGDGGSLYSFSEGPYSDGWRTRFYQDPWTWQDGPANQGGTDLQGIAVHQFGLTLGLAHSSAPGKPSMQPNTLTGIEQRSIEADDIAGLQAIYGPKAAGKPRILGTSLDVANGILTIHGQKFSPTGNRVWFTQAGAGGTGAPVKVLGLVSTNGGTEIVVTVPATAGPGDVLVQKNGIGHQHLSNAWPFDPASPGVNVVIVTGLSPSAFDAVVVDGPPLVMTGAGFLDVIDVTVEGLSLAPSDYVVVDDEELDITAFPPVSQLGPVQVRLTTATSMATTSVTITAPDPPNLDLADSLSEGAFLSSATGLDISLGGEPGDLLFPLFSGSANPSILPGYVELAIGNNFFNLFSLGTYMIPAGGSVHFPLAVTGDLTGVTVHLQAPYLEAGSTTVFPLGATNVQSGTFAN